MTTCYSQCIDRQKRFAFSVLGVEVWWFMVVEVKANRNSEEVGDFWH